jgi:hypothetical protein
LICNNPSRTIVNSINGGVKPFISALLPRKRSLWIVANRREPDTRLWLKLWP